MPSIFRIISTVSLFKAALVSCDDDYSWIKKWAAVGDSFTAGIGSGGGTYNDNADTIACSRWDYTYPTIMNNVFGPSVAQFDYKACSGAVTADIYDQIQSLDNDMDLVVLTAGGNDLCLSAIIGSCISGLNPTESACDDALATAKNSLYGFFNDNIKNILTAIDSKMATNGVVVMTGYAQYFNDQTDACTDEDWRLIRSLGTRLPLTKDRRTLFNTLVQETNDAIKSVVQEVAYNAKTMTLVSASWDPWPPLAGGQFCIQGASPDPKDSSNSEVMFFKPNSDPNGRDELRKRYLQPFQYDNATVVVYHDNNPVDTGVELIPLAPLPLVVRDTPVRPSCPSGPGSSLGLPDAWGKIFHPNENGHEVIAAYVLEAIAEARDKILGVPISCPAETTTTCYSDSGSKAYASAQGLNDNIKDFCQYVDANHPAKTLGWGQSKTYSPGTVEEVTFAVQLSDKVLDFDESQCEDAIGTIINGCDIPSGGNNPMNWKFGGKRVVGEYTYTVNILRTNRPFPPPTKPVQECWGWWQFGAESYQIKGGGWAGWDNGQQTLLAGSRDCSGVITNWEFKYYDQPDSNGYEWESTFLTVIGTRLRCYNNNQVQCGAGGPCDSWCSGNG